jgi:HSA
MEWRAKNEIESPRTQWDYVLSHMKWLREDFKCERLNKEVLLKDVARLCAEEAPKWQERRFSKSGSDGVKLLDDHDFAIPPWAKEEYKASKQAKKSPEPRNAQSPRKIVTPVPTRVLRSTKLLAQAKKGLRPPRVGVRKSQRLRG